MARKTFTTRGEFKPLGRRSTFFGKKVHGKYTGGGFTVTYSSCVRKGAEAMQVSVALEGHGEISPPRLAMNMTPTPELAKIAAHAAFRQHFGINVGDPHEFGKGELRHCKCNTVDPWELRKRDHLAAKMRA